MCKPGENVSAGLSVKLLRQTNAEPMPELKPLNVAIRSDEEIGRLMSNLAHTPFTLDGVEYASVEGFYVSLKFLEAEKRAQMARLYGVRAKGKGSRSRLESTCYQGEWFPLGSDQHHELIKRAIRAKLEQHPDIARAFTATRPRPIVHKTGYPEPPGSKLPARVFCRILSELREELFLSLS